MNKKIAYIGILVLIFSVFAYFGINNYSTKMEIDSLLKNALDGSPDAQYKLAGLYSSGSNKHKISKNLKVAHEWYELAANGGNLPAQMHLGFAYLLGNGIQKNYGLAIKYLQDSVKGGSTAASEVLGAMYLYGVGVNKNDSLALDYIYISQKTIWKTKEDVMWYIGETYKDGDGLPSAQIMGHINIIKNYEEAAKWYSRCANRNHARCMVELAKLYETGAGVRQDITTAINLYKRALTAKQGIPRNTEIARHEAAWALCKKYNIPTFLSNTSIYSNNCGE